ARLFGQIPNTELIAAGLEERVLGVRVLREQTLKSRGRLERAIGILAAGERTVGSALRERAQRKRRNERGRDDEHPSPIRPRHGSVLFSGESLEHESRPRWDQGTAGNCGGLQIPYVARAP